MGDVLADLIVRFADDWTVRRINRFEIEREQAAQRSHVLAEIAGVIGNDGSARAQNYIPRKERLLFDQIIAQMVGRVTRGVDGSQGDPVALDYGAIVNRDNLGSGSHVVLWPRLLKHREVAKLFDHLLDATDVIDVSVGQDNSIESVRVAQLVEASGEEFAIDRDSLSGVEQEGPLAAPDDIGVGARTREGTRIFA